MYGSEKKYYHKYQGFNSRLQPFQGYVLSKKLLDLDSWNHERLEIAKTYNEAFKNNSRVITPKTFKENKHVWHLYVLRVKNRNKVIKEALNLGVELSIHYPVPIHKQLAYKNHKQSSIKFNNADKFSKNIVSLPIFPKMKKTEVTKVIDTLVKVSQ